MLSGCCVLVVEDEALTAEQLRLVITGVEGEVIGPVASVGEARRLLKSNPAIDVALLDVNLDDGDITPVLEGLRARGIPIVVYTGGVVPAGVRDRHPDLISLTKPVAPARLVSELRRATARKDA